MGIRCAIITRRNGEPVDLMGSSYKKGSRKIRRKGSQTPRKDDCQMAAFSTQIAFPTQMEYEIMGITLYIFFFSELIIWMITLRGSRGQKREKADRGTMWLVLGGWLFNIMAVQLWGSDITPKFLRWQLPHFVYYVGILLVGIGIVIRCTAVFTLKRAFTLSVQTSQEQHLIQKGLYRIVRNPAYTGGLISLLGVALVFREITGLVTVIVIGSICYGIRINVEEKALSSRFQKEFQAYCTQTKYRLFPGIY